MRPKNWDFLDIFLLKPFLSGGGPPPPFWQKNPKKSQFFLLRKFWIRRDPPPLSGKLLKKLFFFIAPLIAVGWHWHGRGDFIWGLGYIRDSSDSSNIVCQQINTKAIAGQCVTSGMDLLTLTFLLSFLLVLWKGPCMVDIDRGEEIWLRVGLHQGSKSQTGCDPAPHITVIRIAWLDPHWCLSLNFTECSSFLRWDIIICVICNVRHLTLSKMVETYFEVISQFSQCSVSNRCTQVIWLLCP